MAFTTQGTLTHWTANPMNPVREMMQRNFAEALGCSTEVEYHRKKDALMAYLRRTQPEQFKLEGGRKRAFEHMAAMEGITVEEKQEDLAILGYVIQKSFRRISKADALAAAAACGLPEEDQALVEKILEEIYARA